MSALATAKGWRAYRAVMSARLREMLQYRTAAVAGMVTQVFWGLIRLMIFQAFYRSSTTAQPMSLPETVDYLWLVQALLLLTPWRIDIELQNMIRSGNVAYELAKPADLYGLWFARILGGRAAPMLLRLPLIYGLAALFFGLRLPPSLAAAGAFVLSVLAAFLLSAAISALMTISLMWTLAGDGLSRLTATVATVLSGSIIPLPLFPDSMQPVLNILPFRGLMDIPFRLYSGNIPLAAFPRELAFQLGWALALMVLGRALLGRGLRRLVLQGASMGSTLRLYWAYTRASIRGQMAYRASFIMLTLGNFVATGIEFVALWALFGRFGQIAGWTLPEVALFYGLGNVAFAIAEGVGRGFDTFAALVKRGDFDRILLRPRSTLLQIGASEFQIMRIGRLSQGLAALIWGAAALNLVWASWRIALLLWTLLCGAALFTGLFVLQATSAFWTTESLEVWNTLTYGGVQTAQFPLTLYEDWFRKFFTYAVPLAAITYFPAVAILAKDDPLGTSRLFQAIVPAAGLAFLAGATLFWQVGVRHYHSTGS